MEIIGTLISLYTPLVLFILLIFLLIYVKKSKETSNEIVINIFGIIQFPVSIPSLLVRRILLFLVALFCLLYYLLIDFSSYFPQRLEMQVYYSPFRIKQNLNMYSESELKERNIIYTGFENYQNDYYKNLDERLKGVISDTSMQGFFTKNKTDIHSEGETSFIVEKINGIHNYYIKESIGRLTHVLSEAQSDKFEFKSLFEKDNSEYDFIKPSLWDIIFKQEIIIMPTFKENIVEIYSSSNTKFDHRLYGMTKIYTFPYPKFSNTIYLYENPKIGLIPIGYAVYKEN